MRRAVIQARGNPSCPYKVTSIRRVSPVTELQWYTTDVYGLSGISCFHDSLVPRRNRRTKRIGNIKSIKLVKISDAKSFALAVSKFMQISGKIILFYAISNRDKCLFYRLIFSIFPEHEIDSSIDKFGKREEHFKDISYCFRSYKRLFVLL